MKKHLSSIVLIVVFIIGLSLILYPTISNYWNERHQSRAISQYQESVEQYDTDTLEQMLEDAREYNERLLNKENRYTMTEQEEEEYESLLNVSQNGIMGYIDIPKINCTLPIYHTADTSVLQSAVGHIEYSSLPVGGKGTHCVLSGHRGLPSAKLFSDIDELVEGDTFTVCVLNETLTYEVDQIRIVLPDELQNIEIDPDMDYCTLVTCTPYGVNTHRLLVRGHRVANSEAEQSAQITADAMQVEPVIVATAIAVPVLCILGAGTFFKRKKSGK